MHVLGSLALQVSLAIGIIGIDLSIAGRVFVYCAKK
jgi:hypothetical protein